MFRLPITLSVACILLLGSLLAFFVIHVRPEDRVRYEDLLTSSRHGAQAAAAAAGVRTHVQKTIESASLSCLIDSEHSVVEIAGGETFVARERMQNIACTLTQGDLVRHIGAQKACVDYSAYLLDGEQVTYVAEGDQKIRGRADHVRLPLKKELPWAELKGNVVVELDDQGTFVCDAIALDHKQQTTHFRGNPRLCYTDARGKLLSDEACVSFEEHNGKVEVLKMTLSGSVNLINPEQTQLAIAEKIEIFPREERIFLIGENEHVVYIDHAKGLELSAWKIGIEYHDGEKVQGFGDVRCILQPEQLDALKRRFGLDA